MAVARVARGCGDVVGWRVQFLRDGRWQNRLLRPIVEYLGFFEGIEGAA